MKDRDAADFDLLSLANEKGKFAMQFAAIPPIETMHAFERGIDADWFILVDIAPLCQFEHKIFKIYKLTQAGRDRLAELKERVHQ